MSNIVRPDVRTDRQLDNVGVTKSTHILDLALNTILGTCHIDDVFRDELHGDLVTSESMHGHWCIHESSDQDKMQNGHALLTLPKVPSAISWTIVYSPSFDGGMTGIGSCSLIVALVWAAGALLGAA